jgi:hypothetical protein
MHHVYDPAEEEITTVFKKMKFLANRLLAKRLIKICIGDHSTGTATVSDGPTARRHTADYMQRGIPHTAEDIVCYF